MVEEGALLSLPEELFALIQGYADPSSLARFVLCTSKSLSSAYAPLLKELAIARNYPVTSADLDFLLARFPNVEALSLPVIDGAAFREGYAHPVLDRDTLRKLTRLTRLKNLSVGMYHHLDWSFLTGLHNLEVLIAPEPVPSALLAGMTNLRELRVKLDDESDLSFLDAYPAAQLESLALLSVSDDADLGKISRFKELTHLRLEFIYLPFEIGDHLRSLTKLQSIALLFNVCVSTEILLSLTSSLPLLCNLKHLELSTQGKRKTYLESTDFLFDLPVGLETLKMPSFELLDLSFLDRLLRMRDLAIALGPAIRDCTPLYRLKDLRNLHVESLPIGEISHLPKSLYHLVLVNPRFSEQPPGPVFIDFDLPELKSLQLEVNSDVQVAFSSENLPSLEKLIIFFVVTQDLSFLGQFVGLKMLSIGSTKISDLSFSERRSRLKYLSVKTRRLESLCFLRSLQKLKTLILHSTVATQDFSVLSELPNLTHLEMDGVYVNDFSFLENLSLKILGLIGLSEQTSFESLKKTRNLDIFRTSLFPGFFEEAEEMMASLEKARQALDDAVDAMKPRLFVVMKW